MPQETTFRYDGFGSRVEKTTGTETHRYRWDPTWSVPMLIEDRVVGGDATQVSYGVGPESLTTASGRHDLVTDRMGSVVAVLDEAGAPEASYEWEPDGALRAGQVTAPDAPDLLLGFAGGQYDSDLALYNLRARVYDPLSGRFLQTDPLATPIGQTWTSPYAYVGGKATTMVDPTGMRGEQGYWDAQRNKCNGDGGNIYFVETYRGMQGCFLYNPCVSDLPGPLGDLAEWSCRNHDTLVGILQKTRDIALSLIPGYDCVQIALGRDRSALSYAGCALDLVPFVGSIDDIVTSGAKGLDEALGDMNSVRKAGEEGTAAERVFKCATSFAADTRVLMADGSTKRIVDVEPGDMVMSADPETGEQAPREVVATLPHTDDLLLFDTSAGRVVTTEDHRYWNATDGEWQQSQDLDAGDRLLSADGDAVTVGGLDWASLRTAPAYDLTIAGFHAFYVTVGNDHVLVHNHCVSGMETGFESVEDLLGVNDEIVVLGRQEDTLIAASWPGHVVLQADNWTIELNDRFIAEAIRQKRKIYLASPVEGNLVQTSGAFAGQPTIYARELAQLDAAGYKRVGDYMVPGG